MAKDKELTHEEKLDEIKKIIKKATIGIMTTIAENGLVSRPLAVQETEFDGDVWFVTFRDTSKVKEIEADPRVNVAFNDDDQNYVSIAGQAEIIVDDAKKKELWNKAYEKIFNTTYDDPELVLIKVHAHGAEYWESGSTLKAAYQIVANFVSDKEEDLGENESIDLE